MSNHTNVKSSKQTTLFQSWGTRKKERDLETNKSTARASHSGTDVVTNNAVIDLCDSFDDQDDGLLYDAEESVILGNVTGGGGEGVTAHGARDKTSNISQRRLNYRPGSTADNVCDVSIGADCITPTQGPTQVLSGNLAGFDRSAGKLWIYPTNYPVRDYQYNIVQQALFKNTMVTLPTGLGKTFIAAVVMYNFYQWYPQGKVIFMAPTKPLVAQQIEACYKIMGIPQDHTAEMTGSMNPPKREKAWREKRVFFLTPQVLTNDLSRGSCPANQLKCLVVDEAHKALGNHAYCQVVRELVKYTENFRVLALSATPGSDIKAVQQVLSNLLISHIEIRTEESIDISPYTHERRVDKVVVPLGDELSNVRTKYIHIMDVVVGRLKLQGVLYNRDTTSFSKFLILKAREAFRQNPPEKLQRSQYGTVEGDFALAMSLYHGFELLQLHGLRPLYNFLDGILTGDKGHGRTRSELTRNADFNDLMAMLSDKYRETASQKSGSKPVIIGHPKLEKLQDIVVEHFKAFDKKGGTRVMIFSQYRDSVQEITDMLNRHRPLVKVMNFIGQSSAGKSAKGFTQKEQLKVMKHFREGGYNTLVSTCVGEEGLDIGDVDLIVCFDAHKSPIRLVQRMGRTGRKREGRIVMLVTQGKEEQIYNQSQYSKRSIHKAILNGARSLHFYQNSPRMVPDSCHPAPHKMFITVKDGFRPAKKVDTDGSNRQGKITTFTSDKKDGPPDVLLTEEEYRELAEWQVPVADVPQLPTAELVSLHTTDTTEPVGSAVGKTLSLADWSPWQNTLQPTEQIDHSLASRHLVELMDFIQLQQSLDPGDDPYGLEMAAYLNEDDILKAGEADGTPGSILKFCVPTDPNCGDPGKLKGSKGKRKLLNKPRLSDALPNVLCEEPKEGSSDEELPAFNFNSNQIDIDSDMDAVAIDKQTMEKETVSNYGDVCKPGDFRNKLKRFTHVDASEIDDVDIVRNSIVKNQFANLTTGEKGALSSAKSMEKKMADGKSRKRKRSRHSSRASAVVEVIADTDGSDFDELEPCFDDMVVNEAKVSNVENLDKSKDNLMSKCRNSVDKPGYESSGRTETVDNQEDKLYVIRTPPTIEDAINVCDTIGEAADIAKLDLVNLVEEWEKENENGKYIVYPKSLKKSRNIGTLKIENDTDNHVHLSEMDNNELSHKTVVQLDKVSDRTMSNANKVSVPICDVNVLVANNTHTDGAAAQNVDENTSNGTCNVSLDGNTGEFAHTLASSTHINKANTPIHSSWNTQDSNISLKTQEVKDVNDSFSSTDIHSTPTSKRRKLLWTPECSNSALKLITPEQTSNSEMETEETNTVSPQQKHDQKDEVLEVEKAEVPHSSNILAYSSTSNEKLLSMASKRAQTVKNDTVIPFPLPLTTKQSVHVSNNDFDDSWGLDDTGDDLMLAVKTPAKPNLNHTHTQVTFTQALACVHSCSSIESDSHSEAMSTPSAHVHGTQPFLAPEMSVISQNTEQDVGHTIVVNNRLNPTESFNTVEHVSNKMKEGTKLDDNLIYVINIEQKHRTSDSKTLETAEFVPDNIKYDANILGERSTSPTLEQSEDAVSKASSPDMDYDLPEFDLGFDFDDEIVPPSPNATHASQTSGIGRLSQAFGNKLSQTRCVGEDMSDEDKTEVTLKDNSNRENSSSNLMNCVLRKSLLLKSRRSLKLFNNCETKTDSENTSKASDVTQLSQPIAIRSIPRVNTCNLKDNNKTKLCTVQEIQAHESVLDVKDNIELASDDDVSIDKSEENNSPVSNKCPNSNTDHDSRKEIELNTSTTLQKKSSEHLVNQEVDIPTMESSFMLLDDDLDDWIDSGAEIQNKNDNKEDSMNKTDDNGNNTSTFRSSSCTKNKSKTPIARVFPMTTEHQRLDVSERKACTKTAGLPVTIATASLLETRTRSFENKTPFKDIDLTTPIVTKARKGRKSQFVFDDFSPDCFDDSFDTEFSSRKKTISDSCKSPHFNASTSTPLHCPQHKINMVTPQRQNEECTSALINLDTPKNSSKHSPEPRSDNDDSFVVRRKRKVCVIASPLSQVVINDNECDMSKSMNSDRTDLTMKSRNSVDKCKINRQQTKMSDSLFSSEEDSFDDSVLLTKKSLIVGKRKAVALLDSDDDFDEPVAKTILNRETNSVKSRHKESHTGKSCDNMSVNIRNTNVKKAKSSRTSNPFICEEAELSDEDAEDVSEDEHEHSDIDAYEDSFIHDSQFAESQVCSQTDMQAVYLKSVQSPNPCAGKYKLQYNYKHVDVFSQVPQEDESHYMEDSFCVGEEDDDWLGGLEGECEPEEVTVYQPEATVLQTGRKRRRGVGKLLETGRQREIRAGRMRALDEIKARLAGKKAKNNQMKSNPILLSSSDDEVTENAPKRSRIQMLHDDSSSEEDTNVQSANNSHLNSIVNRPSNVMKTRKAKIVSSSDEEDISDFMPKGNVSKLMPFTTMENYDVRNTCNQKNKNNLKEVDLSKTRETENKQHNLKTDYDIRQERLQRQQLRQEEYRRNLANTKAIPERPANESSNSWLSTVDKDSSLTKIKPKISTYSKLSNESINHKTLNCTSVTERVASPNTGLFDNCISRSSISSGKPVVLVDSKEISGSQDIVSDLRFKHNVHVSVAQLPGCDFILSNRMAVERKQWSEFSNGINRAKLIERMQHLADLYDRPCLIVESDRLKHGEEKSTKQKHWTKYVDRTIAMLLRSEVKVLFTDNQAESAALIADLCQLEHRKGMSITVPVDLSSEKQSVVKFFVSIPKLSYIHALNLCSGFGSVSEFMRSTVGKIQKKGQMTESRAIDVCDFLKRTFDSDMLPSVIK